MSDFIPLSVPCLDGNELKYVSEAIESEWVSTAGSFVNTFEEKTEKYLAATGVVACQSGTAGIHLALLALGIDDRNEVIVPTLTFIAAVNPVKYVGAEPVFMDCDDSLCMDPLKFEAFCASECDFVDNKLIDRTSGKHIKAVIVVHVFGNMADMEKICLVAEKYNISIIEDATEAMGTFYTEGKFKGMHAGTIGDLGVYSFNGNKIITTGGGGMVTAKRKDHLQYIRYLSTQAKDDEVSFNHNQVGYNYRMTNLQAALGVAQLEQLERFIVQKKQNYDHYLSQGLSLLPFRQGIRWNCWFYSWLYNIDNRDTIDKMTFINKLAEHSIQARPVWGLIHEQKPYQGCRQYKIEKAEYYQKNIINIPCSSNLTEDNIRLVADTIKKIAEQDY